MRLDISNQVDNSLDRTLAKIPAEGVSIKPACVSEAASECEPVVGQNDVPVGLVNRVYDYLRAAPC